MFRPIFEDFHYTGADNLVKISEVVAERKSIAAPTNETIHGIEQKLATFLSTPSKIAGDEILVRLTEFADENGRPSGAIFDSLIAESTGRRVISTNLPGIDFYGDPLEAGQQSLTPEQAKDLYEGSFRKVGSAIMYATLNAAESFQLDPKFVILGTSMSAAISAGALSAARENTVDIKGATFAEPTNVVARSAVELGAQFIMAGRTAKGYVAMNPQILRDVSEPVLTITKRALKPVNYLYARAVAAGSLIPDLGPIDHLENVPIFISRGAASRVSSENSFYTLRNHLAQTAPVDTKVYGDRRTNPHDHGYVLAVEPFISAAKNVLER